MSLTDDLMALSEKEKADYAESENAASEVERADDEWDIDEISFETPSQLDGVIVDTREWLETDIDNVMEINLPHAERNLLLTCAGHLNVNRFISASNFRRAIA